MGEDAYVISVGAGKNQIPLVQRLVERGYIVVAFDKNKSAPGKQLSHIFNNISTWDYEDAIQWLSSLKLKFRGALSFSYGKALVTQQKIIDFFNLEGKLGENFVNIMADKSYQRRILCELGLSTLKEFYSYNDISNNVGHKFIVKDKVGGSSNNILLIQNNNYGKEKLEEKIKTGYIIQEFLDGEEYRIVSIIKDKRIEFFSVMERTNIKTTFFTGRLRPERNYDNAIFSLLKKVIDKFEITDSAIKIDIIKETNRIEILEIDFGIPGDYFETTISNCCYNYNYIDNYINLMLGLPVEHKISLDNELCFDYVYNNKDKEFIVDYSKIFYVADKYFDNYKIIKIKEQDQVARYPNSNMDAVFAIVHNRMNLSNYDVNQIFNDALHSEVL